MLLLEAILLCGAFLAYSLRGALLSLGFEARRGTLDALLAAALILHLCWAAARVFSSGHLPLTNLYESLSLFSLLLGAKLPFLKEPGERLQGILSLPAALLLAIALLLPSGMKAPAEIEPALRSPWIFLHVPSAFMGYASLALALVAAACEPRSKIRLGALIRREMKVGFFALSLGIIAGGFWAQECWAVFWSWDPKETAALVTWAFLAAALHPMSRLIRNILLSLAAASMLFTYIGVTYLLPGLHSYLG